MPVADHPERRRFELTEGGATAYAAYELTEGTIRFTHTVVPPEIEGRGVGSRLVAGALAEARARGLKVVAECSFVAAYIDRHPAERDLLA